MTEASLPEPRKRAQAISEFAVVAVCTLAFTATVLSILAAMIGPKAAGSRDSIEYWTASYLLLHGANPYDANASLTLEHAAGYPDGLAAQLMANPPSALLLLLPLGFLPPTLAELLWILLLIASFAISVQTLRKMLGGSGSNLHLLAYAFAPALSCLLAGQIGLFLLLGLVLFLRWQPSHPMLAGASLWFCLLKPHLFLPFGLILFIWIFLTRNYRVLAGSTLALCVSSAVATAIDPEVWRQYQQMMVAARIDRMPLPCLGVLLRQYVYPHTSLIQCAPEVVGCIWAIGYFWPRHAEWDWMRHGSILILVSVLVAPYSWFMDQTVLIPALLAGAYASGSRTWIAILALMSAGIEIEAMRGAPLIAPFYLWPAPAWLLWFLIATRKTNRLAPSI